MLALLLSGENFPAGKKRKIGWACAIFEKLTKKYAFLLPGAIGKIFVFIRRGLFVLTVARFCQVMRGLRWGGIFTRLILPAGGGDR